MLHPLASTVSPPFPFVVVSVALQGQEFNRRNQQKAHEAFRDRGPPSGGSLGCFCCSFLHDTNTIGGRVAGGGEVAFLFFCLHDWDYLIVSLKCEPWSLDGDRERRAVRGGLVDGSLYPD